MTAKEFLRQYEEQNKRALRYKAEYDSELECIDTIRSTLGGDGMPHGSGISRRTEDAAIKLSEKAARWKEAEIKALNIRQQVFDMIRDVPGVEGDVLYERYINLRRWEDICVLIHYSWRGTHKVHARALILVENKMNRA